MNAPRVGLTYGNLQKVGPYADALREAGLEPVLISPADGARSLEGCAGLLLSGGSDVNPKVYGEAADEHTQLPDDSRDTLELRLLHEALDKDLPVLAICRGMQLFNVAHPGGRLHQHLEGHEFRPPDPSQPAHVVMVQPETVLASIVEQPEVEVNSRHHQAVAQPGANLVVSAIAPDGVIEALERPDKRFAVAVEWHPEDQRNLGPHRKLFAAFARACGIE